MKQVTKFFFFIYKTIVRTFFFILGIKTTRTCRFYPTCSKYSQEVFIKYGFLKGLLKTIRRIVTCHPWNEGGVDLP